MRILLDTNVFIDREDNHIISEDLQQLLSILNKVGYELLIHPLSLREISKDKNQLRKTILTSKVESYSKLEKPPNPSSDSQFLSIIGIVNNDHDLIDNYILYAIYKDAADFLITEDKGIHKKANKLGLNDRILLIGEALKFFHGQLPKGSLNFPPALEETFVYNLDINDPFFDSLKASYSEFVEWFGNISRQGRKCFVHYKESIAKEKALGALLIYKIENETIDAGDLIP
jgi:hypothetical protein